jgi:GNAT superfamily N-acetyltransferase
MGWAFLRRSESSDVMEIPELFVWPTFRRMGIARILEKHAVDVALEAGITEIHLMLNEADAVVGPPRAQARAFAKALGYDWRWRVEVGPRRPGTGIKTL